MAKPVFLIGACRNGTTFTERLIRMSPDVSSERFVPCDRWEFPAIMEIGGVVGDRPYMHAFGRWFIERPESYALVRLAVPWAYCSLGWPLLLQDFPTARFVLIVRNWYDAWQSWSKMPHVEAVGIQSGQELYRPWAVQMQQVMSDFTAAHRHTTTMLSYERLVEDADATMAPVWKMLGVRSPLGLETLQSFVRKPAHWTEMVSA